jgi:APA family basic amino acid/polyamine antiporter
MTQSPIRATALLAVLASVFVFVASFQEIVAYFMCTTLVFIALAAGALVVVRRRGPAAVAFHAPGYPITPIFFVLLVLGVVVLVSINRPVEALAGFVVVLLGIPAYRLFVKNHER